MPHEGNIIEPQTQTGQAPSRETDEPSTAPRFLVENFALIRNLQKDDPIYVLSREQAIAFQRQHGSRIGRDPIIAVHNMDALDRGGAAGFHGFGLSLGLLCTPSRRSWGCRRCALSRDAPPLDGSRSGHPRQSSSGGAHGCDRNHHAS